MSISSAGSPSHVIAVQRQPTHPHEPPSCLRFPCTLAPSPSPFSVLARLLPDPHIAGLPSAGKCASHFASFPHEPNALLAQMRRPEPF